MTDFLFYAGVLIIVVLSAVAITLHWRLYKVKQEIKMRKAEVEQQYHLARAQLNQSVQIICRALLADQVECAEASIRISALMNQLSVNGAEREEFVAFDKLAEAISHVPILDAWKQLPKAQKKEFTSQIEQQEQLLGDFVRDAAQRMIGRTF
jgi:aryl carrier-like protein